MVDTLVSGASASRHVGSSPIIRTKKRLDFSGRFFRVLIDFLYFFWGGIIEKTIFVVLSPKNVESYETIFNCSATGCSCPCLSVQGSGPRF